MQLFSASAAAIALASLGEYLFGVNLGIDALLVTSQVSRAVPSIRMSVPTAANLFLLGGALCYWRRPRGIVFRQCLVLLVGSIALLNAISFLYGVKNFYGLTPDMGMALHTSFVLLLICSGALLSRPDRGLIATVTSHEPGGLLSRRLLPAALLIPTALGWLRWQGQLKGFYDTSFGLSLFVSANVVMFALLIWVNGELLNRLGSERSRVEHSLYEAKQRLTTSLGFSEIAAWTWTGYEQDSVTWSGPMESLFGVAPGRLDSYADLRQLIVPEDREMIDQKLAHSLDERTSYSSEFRIVSPDGKLRWISAIGGVILDQSGAVKGMAGVNFDITGRKTAELRLEQSERALREREQQLALVFDKGGIGDFTWDISRDEVSAHRTIWKLYGAPKDLDHAPASWFEQRRHRTMWHGSIGPSGRCSTPSARSMSNFGLSSRMVRFAGLFAAAS